MKILIDVMGGDNAPQAPIGAAVKAANELDVHMVLVGDTEIIEADNGFYLMFYVEKSDLNYREYMINNEMRAADYQKWYNG